MNDYQTWGYTYKKGRGYYEPLLSRDEDEDKGRKLKHILAKQERLAREQYEREHQYGYCPKCHCLIRLNGKCDNCD